MEVIIDDLQEVMESIFLSGFSSVKESTLDDIKDLIDRCSELGLSFAETKLKSIYDEINKKFHSTNFDYSKVVDDYYILNEYIKIVGGAG